MRNTIQLPIVRRMILQALMIARERVQEPVTPVQVVPVVHANPRKVVYSIKDLREKAWGGTSPEIQTGFAELVMSITELEISLHEAMGDFAYAQGGKAEKLKQRIIQLQLQLTKLHAQKAKLPVQDEKQEMMEHGRKFKK